MRFGSQSNSVAPQKGFCPPLWLKFISVFKIHSKIYPLPCFQKHAKFSFSLFISFFLQVVPPTLGVSQIIQKLNNFLCA